MEHESKTLEFKENKTRTYLKTVSAFANYIDGEIRFGVSDNGELKPIENQIAFALSIETQINDNIKPHPDYSLVNNTEGTISLFVKKGDNTPYLFDNKAYKRNDTATIEVDDIELKRLILEGTNTPFDKQIYKGTNKLTFVKLEEYLKKEKDIKSLNDDILKSLNLLTPKGYNLAASLLADKNDFSGIDIAVYGDNEDSFKERHTLKGISLLEQFDEAIAIFERNYTFEKVASAKRERVENIPLIAFREVIANAIVHRTYDINKNTKVSMYKDRIEINSPGGLVSGIKKEEFLRGAFSQLRNEVVADVFKTLHIIEAFGTGINRTIRSYKDNLVKPSFNVFDDSISVVLPKLGGEKLSRKDDEILKSLSPNIKYTREEIEHILGVNKDKAIRILNKLISDGLLSKEGNGRNTLYLKP